jgi:PAS domain-containing protein
MPLTLSQLLAVVRNHLASIFTTDAAFAADRVITEFAADPTNLLPHHHRRASDTPLVSALWFRLNRAMEVVEVSPPLQQLLEVADRRELLGLNWERFLEPDELKRRWEAWGVAAQTRMAFSHRYVFITPNGRRLRLREHLMPVLDPRTMQFQGWIADVGTPANIVKMPPRLPPAKIGA